MPANKKMNGLDKIAKRFGITAREARDIATAVGTLAKATTMKGASIKSQAAKNVVSQVKETARAATTGQPGRTSGKIASGGYKADVMVTKGKKRK